MVWGLEPDPPWLMKFYHDPLGFSILIYSPGWFDHSTNSMFSQSTGQRLPGEACSCQLTAPWAQQLSFPAGKIWIVSKHFPSWNTRSNIKNVYFAGQAWLSQIYPFPFCRSFLSLTEQESSAQKADSPQAKWAVGATVRCS